MAEQHPLVAQLVDDPYDPPRTVVLTGFLGDSDDDAKVRLYLEVELRSWFDIPGSAIRHQVRRASEGDALAADVVWVANDAELLPGQLDTGDQISFYPEVPAELLQHGELLREPLLFRSDPIGRGSVSANHPLSIGHKKKKGKKKPKKR